MKTQIVYDDPSTIEGFQTVDVKYGTSGLEQVVNNSSEEIYITNCLDRVDFEEANKILMIALTKLRLNGKILVNGTNLRTLCLNVIANEVDAESFSKVISNCSSLRDGSDIEEILTQHNLTIETNVIRGNTYEITAIRTNS